MCFLRTLILILFLAKKIFSILTNVVSGAEPVGNGFEYKRQLPRVL